MVKFDTEQRKLLADKLCDCGNLAAGALLFGQFLADRLSIVLVGVGLAA